MIRQLRGIHIEVNRRAEIVGRRTACPVREVNIVLLFHLHAQNIRASLGNFYLCHERNCAGRAYENIVDARLERGRIVARVFTRCGRHIAHW